jgi:hypothetical protein
MDDLRIPPGNSIEQSLCSHHDPRAFIGYTDDAPVESIPSLPFVRPTLKQGLQSSRWEVPVVGQGL